MEIPCRFCKSYVNALAPGNPEQAFFLHTCMQPYKFPWNALYD